MKPFYPGKSIIPVSGQSISDDDVAVLHEVVDSRWYTDHKYCAEFKRNLAKYCGKKHVILTNSGSSANLVAMLTALEHFDKDIEKKFVVTTALAFPTTIAPIYQSGKLPIYIDINPTTFRPDNAQLFYASNELSHSIAGAILTHILGFPFHERIHNTLWKFLISDCCDSLGATMFDKHVGSSADLMTLSFFPAHHITSIEGGAVLTDNDELAKIAESYVNWGRSCYCAPGQSNTCGVRFNWPDNGLLPEHWDHKYIFDRVGYNLKMTEFQAALGNSQLSRVESFVADRVVHYHYYLEYLDIYNEFLQFIYPEENIEYSPFGFPIIVKDTAPFDAGDLIAWLEAHRVTTRRMFGGNITRQPGFMNLPYKSFGLAGTDYVANNGFWIGVQPSLTTEMMDYVIEVFEDFFKENNIER
jgi:CDP-6-deoxy-D-xylo-4-hexulose-3-dehydrase